MDIAGILADIDLAFGIDLDAIRIDMADVVGEIVQIQEQAPIGERARPAGC